MKPNSRSVFLLILGTFFVSGTAGLLYQVVWTRYLALFLGHTSYAVVAVLAAFMGGLALGNAWLGAKVDTMRQPLKFYAALEAGIGLYAALFPNYYEFVHNLFLGFIRSTRPEGLFRLTLQFVFAGATILLPTILMGATLPALTRYVTRSLGELRGKVSSLYAINSAGAVTGVLLADGWWIPELGLERVVYLGASLSLIISLVAYVVSVRGGERSPDSTRTPIPLADETFTPLELRVALIATGVSGFVAMLYEIAWTRLLALALGSSTHAYSLMLATFIGGITVGSWLVSRWRRQTQTLTAFAWAELALAGTLLLSIGFYDLLPFWFSKLSQLLARRPEAYPVYELIQALICFGVMFIPAVCLGMTLPLVSRVATVDIARTGRSVGRVFAVNTLGTVLGAVLTGLILLPFLGLASTFALGIGLNISIGLVVLGAQRGRILKPCLQGLAVTSGLFFILTLGLGERWSRTFSLGLWREAQQPQTVAQYRARAEAFNLNFFCDGAGATIAVVEVPGEAGQKTIGLKINGKVDASSGDDMSTQMLVGHIPSLLHPHPVEALVVGAGSGVTVGSLLQFPEIERVDLVEISPEVIVAARDHFAPYNHDALRNPRCHISIEDAKTFLQTTTRQYDLIITEPSNPWMAGVAAVFSREYYLDCRERLKPGGLCAQWVQTYETDDSIFETVVATFGSVFPYLSLWQTSVGDLLLVGGVSPFTVNLDTLAKRLAVPAVAADLKTIEITQPVNILTLQVTGFGDAFFLARGETRLHSDFNPVLEYRAQKAFFVRGQALVPFQINEAQRARPRSLLGDYLEAHPLTTNDCRALAVQFAKTGLPQLPIFRSILHQWRSLDPLDPLPFRLLTSYSVQNPPPDGDAARMLEDPLFKKDEILADLGLLRQYGDMLLLRYRARRSSFHTPSSGRLEQILGALVALDLENQRVHRLRLAEVCWDRRQDVRARSLFDEALNPDLSRFGPFQFTHDTRVLGQMMDRLIDVELRSGSIKQAMELISRFSTLGFLQTEQARSDIHLNMLARRVIATAEELPRSQ